MTVSSTNTKRQFNGDGSTAAFAYNFKVFADADLQVIVRSATGTESVKSSGTHYNASGVGETSGGTVTFTSGNIPASGETITLRRAKTIAQELDLVANDPFPAASLEDQLDKLTHLILQNNEELDRAIKLSRTNTMTSTEFTQSAADRASKVLSFDSSGEIAVTQELGTFRGNWAASTAYNERDIIRDNSATGNQSIYIVITAHTSSGSLPITTNTDAAKFSAIIDNTTATTTTNVTSITNDALVVGRDADNQLKFSTDNQIIFRVGAGDGVTFKASGEIEATSLDISGDADIDGTLEADAITIGGTTLAETIADTVGAMVSSNTESGIAVTYDDSDNTLDFTVASLTTVGALDSGSITSGFGAIDVGSSTITSTGEVGVGRLNLSAVVSSGDLGSDKAQVGYGSTDGLLLMGQGSSNDVAILNDTGNIVAKIPTGTAVFLVDGAVQTTMASGGKVYLTTSETTVVANDVLGAVEFYATSEASGTDSVAKAASIEVVAEGEFTATANPSKMDFKLGVSEAATTKMSLSSGGVLSVTELDISGDVDVDGTLETDNLTVGGAQGSDGQVLTSTGSGVAWETPSSTSIPSGIIAMWSGSSGAIPTGWVICDGNNSTPNLTDKFIKAAASAGGTGGSATSGATTLDIAAMPAHTHSKNYTPGSAAAYAAATLDSFFDGASGTGSSTGGGGSHTHTIEPPYYALIFIMKT